MKKQKMFKLFMIMSLLVIILLPTQVKATEEKWTNFSGAKLEIVPKPNGNVSLEDATSLTYHIRISNIALNPTSEYLVYLHYQEEEISENKVLYHHHAVIKEGESEAQINNVKIENLLQKNGDIYISILERKGKEIDAKKQLVLTAQKIERPELLPRLGNRLQVYFDKRSTTTYFWAPNVMENGDQVDRTLNIKIGQVTDTNLLKDIKEDRVQGFGKLLDYAKNVSPYNYEGKVQYKGNSAGITESLTSQMNLVNDAYYFAYIELDDENGVYYPVEDIALYRAKGTLDLVRYSDKEFVFNLPEDNQTGEEKKPEVPKEEPKPQQPTNQPTNTAQNVTAVTTNQVTNQTAKDTTQAAGVLPKTGVNKVVMGSILGLILLAIVLFKKCEEYRNI